jgi:hypothetical protein
MDNGNSWMFRVTGARLVEGPETAAVAIWLAPNTEPTRFGALLGLMFCPLSAVLALYLAAAHILDFRLGYTHFTGQLVVRSCEII